MDGINSYSCDCSDTGFKGAHCEINVDDCESAPCVHGSLCVDQVKDYKCECFPGYEGKDCQIDINECEVWRPSSASFTSNPLFQLTIMFS